MDDRYITIVRFVTLTGRTYEHLTSSETIGEFLSNAELSDYERNSYAIINGKRIGEHIILSSRLTDYADIGVVTMQLLGL